MSDFQMTIGGEASASASMVGVINPSKGEVFTEVPDCTREQLDAAMTAADQAYRTWRQDEGQRREALLACAAALEANIEDMARILVMEQGKPIQQATEEVGASALWLQYTAGLEIPVEVVQDDETCRIEVHRRPLGVVAAITPWNFPLLLGIWKIAPALLAGNTVVIKPSPFTPLTTLKLGEILRPVLPPGVLNTISGGNDVGAWMTAHPVVRKISFTGSVATGKRVAMAAADDLKRTTLELGGNDAAIVLDDCSPKEVAEKIFWGAFTNTGQICSAIKRAYVADSIYDSVVDELGQIARNVKVGDGLDPASQVGPLNNKPQFDRVSELVEDAKKSGARIVAGGDPVGGPGYFFQPTIAADVSEGVRLVDEEQFGPALPVIRYSDVDDAIERANGTMFGLSGSVWSPDSAKATAVARQLDCGTAWVNQHLAIVPNAPFGGAKWSGIGVENGPWGLLGFTELRTVNISKA